jgi:predicted adenine nucleotide alpha hydrolase (AANH) superfamily ATPase
MNKTDYNKEFKCIIDRLDADYRASGIKDAQKKKLLLHACCAPCSSICIERVRDHFDTTVYFFNPNITIEDECLYRLNELKRLIDIYNDMPGRGHINLINGDYDPDVFFSIAKGYEDCPERGARCSLCYELRLKATADTAIANGYDYFATTLTLSPLKDVERLNGIGYRLSKESDGRLLWLPSDFKKEDGYKKSIELSKEYNLYRQNYCGCVYSRRLEDMHE